MKLQTTICSIVLFGATAALAMGCDDKKVDPETTTTTHTTAGDVGILPQSNVAPNNPRQVTMQGAKMDAGATGTITGAGTSVGTNVGGNGPGGGSGGQPQTGAGGAAPAATAH